MLHLPKVANTMNLSKNADVIRERLFKIHMQTNTTFVKVLSNTDHMTLITFGHFAIVLTSLYRQQPQFCREDLRRAIMTS